MSTAPHVGAPAPAIRDVISSSAIEEYAVGAIFYYKVVPAL